MSRNGRPRIRISWCNWFSLQVPSLGQWYAIVRQRWQAGSHLWEPYVAPLKQNDHLPLPGLVGISIPPSGTLGQYVIDPGADCAAWLQFLPAKTGQLDNALSAERVNDQIGAR